MLPELQAQNVNDLPVLKADALKFLTTFRSQLPKDACVRIFERLVVLLGSESNVVHTYAATAVERLLSSKASASCPHPRLSVQCRCRTYQLLLVRCLRENSADAPETSFLAAATS